MKAIRSIFTILFALTVSYIVILGQTTEEKTVPAADLPQPANSRNDSYRVGYQDVLEIQVFRHADLNVRVSINPDGTIFLPRATKPIQAYCKTERELKAIIEQDYKSFLKNPYVNVIVAEQKSQSFAIMGAVEKPANYFINRRVPLLELLATAGGANKEAGSKLIVARLGSSSACRLNMEQEVINPDQIVWQSFNIKDLQQGRKSFLMQAGDVVSVLESDIVYVYGNVRKPGEVKFKEPRTLRQIIVSAEGFAPSAKKDKIRVLRQKPDSTEWTEQTYSIKDIDSGKVQDPVLQPNDIVAVSEDKFNKIAGTVVKSLTGGLGNLPYLIP